VEGVSDYDQLVGDYTNPILQPWAADVVKKFGEMSIAGITYGNPSNQCWPMPMPFIYKQFLVQIIQQPDGVLLIYTAPNTDVRRVRLNEQHPSPLTPSWYGDSVGHYEGDTLVIDAVGVKTDRPYAMTMAIRGSSISIRVRRALLFYALKRLGLDIAPGGRPANEQHITLLNRDEVQAALIRRTET